jgi:hypothetical protein
MELRGFAGVEASKSFNVIGFPGIIRQLIFPSVYPAFTVIFLGVAFSTLGRVNRKTPSFNVASILL